MSEGDKRKKYIDNKSHYQGTKYNYNRGRGGNKSQYTSYVIKEPREYSPRNYQQKQPNYDQEIYKPPKVTVYSIKDLLNFFQKDDIPKQMNQLSQDYPDLFCQKSHVPVNFDKSIKTPLDANELFVQISRGGNNGNRQDNRDRGPPKDYTKTIDFYDDEDKEPAWMTTNTEEQVFEFKSFDKEKLKKDFKSRKAQSTYVQPEYIPGENQNNENAFKIFLQSKQVEKDKPNELLTDIDQMLEKKYQQEKKDESQLEEIDQQVDLSDIKLNEESSCDDEWDNVDDKDKQVIIQQNQEKKQKFVEYNKVELSAQSNNEKNLDQPKLEDRFSMLKNFIQPPQQQLSAQDVVKNPVPVLVHEIEKIKLIQEENNKPTKTRDPWDLSYNEPIQNPIQQRSKLLDELNITPSPGKSTDLLEHHDVFDLTSQELKINKFENNFTKIFHSQQNDQASQNKPQSPSQDPDNSQDSMQKQQQVLYRQSQLQQQQILQQKQQMMAQQLNPLIQLQQQQQEQLSQRISVLEFKRDSNLQKSLTAPFNSYTTAIQYPNDINVKIKIFFNILKAWYYVDQKNFCQGPFTSEQMDIWYNNNYFMDELFISFMERERQNFFSLKRLKENLVQSIKATFQQYMEQERNNYLAIMGQQTQIRQQTTQSHKFKSVEEIEQDSQQIQNCHNSRNYSNQQYNKNQQNQNINYNYPQYQQMNYMGMNYLNSQNYNPYQQQQMLLQQQILQRQQQNQSQYVRKNSGQNIVKKISYNNSAQLIDQGRNQRQYQQQSHPLIPDVDNIEKEKDISIRSNQDLSSEVKYNAEDFPSLGESMKK